MPSIIQAVVWAALVGCFWSPAWAQAGMTYKASDGEPIHATWQRADTPAEASVKRSSNAKAVALLFHQANGNRHEYDAIAPRLNAMGFDTLAVDQRSGGSLFDHTNQTVAARGSSASYTQAYADLKGALTWAQTQGYSTIIAVGSSYSASLTLRLAAQYGDKLTAVAVFSPGEYFDDKHVVRQAVSRLHIPTYITTDPNEEARVDEVMDNAHSGVITRYRPAHGVHGASTLDSARDPDGAKANWASFSAFMSRFLPPGD